MRDADGYFYIEDRKKDMIKVSGFNVFPNEIENVLAGHPKVLEVAAIGVPDSRSGEVIKVFVVIQKRSGIKKSPCNFFRGTLIFQINLFFHKLLNGCFATIKADSFYQVTSFSKAVNR